MSLRLRMFRAPCTVLYRMMSKMVEWVCGIYLPYTVIVGRRVKLEHFGGMVLVAERIGNDVTIRQNTTIGIAGLQAAKNRPIIGDRVEIGAGAVLIGDIKIGNDVVIGANAVVIKDVAERAIVAGVPARVIRHHAPEKKIRSIG